MILACSFSIAEQDAVIVVLENTPNSHTHVKTEPLHVYIYTYIYTHKHMDTQSSKYRQSNTRKHADSGSCTGRLSGPRGSSRHVVSVLTILKRKLVIGQEVERQIAEHR